MDRQAPHDSQGNPIDDAVFWTPNMMTAEEHERRDKRKAVSKARRIAANDATELPQWWTVKDRNGVYRLRKRKKA